MMIDWKIFFSWINLEFKCILEDDRKIQESLKLNAAICNYLLYLCTVQYRPYNADRVGERKLQLATKIIYEAHILYQTTLDFRELTRYNKW